MEKIKQFIGGEKGKDILVIMIVILVGLGSFELGRLSKENSSSGIKIGYPSQGQLKSIDQTANVNPTAESVKITATTKNSNSIVKNFFASNRGSKYYPTGCSAGKTIKLENRVYFATREEAVAAGYTLSSSCN